MEKDESWLSISEMSNICQISRQTLIYYDKNNIFKPAFVDENGYRYYTIYQVPFLREICVLKDNDVPLKDIVANFEDRTVESTVKLLNEKKEDLEKQINGLEQNLNRINARLKFYHAVKNEQKLAYQPYVSLLRSRKILFCPWEPTGEMGRMEMHFVHMKLRRRLSDYGLKPNIGWGAMLRSSNLENPNPLEGAGAYVNLPDDFENTYGIPEEYYLILPEGFYACMGKFGMPYETHDILRLKQWIDDNRYIIVGDVYDECLLDTTFYTSENQSDFCLLMVPIRLPGVSPELGLRPVLHQSLI